MFSLFKKKKYEPIVGKYQLNDLVSFNSRSEQMIGRIVKLSKDDNGDIIYSVQVGGECPIVINGIKESSIHPFKRRY